MPNRLSGKLAALGFAISLSAVLELTTSVPRSDVILFVGTLLCPPALLSIFSFDLNEHSIEGTLGWLAISTLNAGWYALRGVLVRGVFRHTGSVART